MVRGLALYSLRGGLLLTVTQDRYHNHHLLADLYNLDDFSCYTSSSQFPSLAGHHIIIAEEEKNLGTTTVVWS